MAEDAVSFFVEGPKRGHVSDGVFVESWNHAVTTPPSKFLEYLKKCNVEGIEQKGSKFTFRCPMCGDSATVKSKRRGFLISNMDGGGVIGCHNCGERLPFFKFLKREYPDVHRKWVQDVYIGISLDSKAVKEVVEEQSNEAEVVDYSKFISIKTPSQSPIRKMAMEFICKRRIPKHIARDFLYCENGRYANRVIIPHYNKDMTYKHFEARDLRKDPWIKYLYPELWEPSCYNLPNLELGRQYYAFEGAIDSMFLRNAGACGGAQKYDFFFQGIHKSLHRNGVVFADGDKDGIKVAFKYLKKGYRVFKWTRELVEYAKDLNGLVEKGFFTPEQFNEDGTIKDSAIERFIVSPTIGEILCFQMEALDLGVNVLERREDVEFARKRREADRTPRQSWGW